MPFRNIPVSGRSDFEDAEFTTHEDSDEFTCCTFFPKNPAGEAIRKIEIANALMITLEQAIVLGPQGMVLGVPFNSEAEVQRMADDRCELMERFARIFCGNQVNGRCLARGAPRPGFKFVNCEPEPDIIFESFVFIGGERFRQLSDGTLEPAPFVQP